MPERVRCGKHLFDGDCTGSLLFLLYRQFCGHYEMFKRIRCQRQVLDRQLPGEMLRCR